jgi:hypothetical protein
MLRNNKHYPASVRDALALSGILLLISGNCLGFHTPYKPEKSRHFDVTKSETFVPVTDKVQSLYFDAG